MLVPAFILGVRELNPDFSMSDLNRKCLQIVAFAIEATAAFQIEAPAVPVAGQNTVPDSTASQRITHMRALVIGRVDPPVHVEQRDAPSIVQPDGFGFTLCNINESSHTRPLHRGSC